MPLAWGVAKVLSMAGAILSEAARAASRLPTFFRSRTRAASMDTGRPMSM